ncbi:MAG: FecR family protein [Chitinophagaceae bacterium]
MFDKLRCRELLKKYLEGTINYSEHIELFKMSTDVNIEELLAEMIDADYNADQLGDVELPSTASDEILKKILASEKNTDSLFINTKRKRLIRQLSVAAIFLIIVIGAAIFYFKPVKERSHGAFEAFIPKNSLKKINKTSRPFVVVLEDGSRVKLSSNSSLSFPLHFVTGRREVYLTGEAFFMVTKNPNAPFFVYYNNIVTRVLGTSFSIKTNSSTRKVEVSVTSGKVQVIENKFFLSGDPSRDEVKSVIVIPNQKAMYNEKSHYFETTLADSINPLPNYPGLAGNSKITADIDSFYFPKATNLKQVLSQLETVYGIEIIVDNENIYNCVFTGDISKQDMWKKLNILCLTIGATYEVKGTKILVSGNGCR